MIQYLYYSYIYYIDYTNYMSNYNFIVSFSVIKLNVELIEFNDIRN